MEQHKRRIISYSNILFSFFLVSVCLSACATSNAFEDHVVSGNYANAVAVYEDKISGNSSKELEAKNFLLDHIQNTLSAYASGEIDTSTAESTFDCLLEIDNELCVLNIALGQALEQFTLLQMSKETFEQASAAMSNGDYEDAAALFADVSESDTQNYEAAAEQLDLCNKAIYATVASSIEQQISDGKYELALHTFDQFFENHMELVTMDMSERFEDCKKDYRNQVIAKSIDLYHSDGAESAEAAIRRGLQVLQDDQSLSNVSNLYLSVVNPVLVSQLTGIKDGEVTLNGSNKTDSLGKNHNDSNLIYFFNLSDARPILGLERNTYGAYTTLTGDMFFLDTGYDMAASIKIYADSETVFDSGSLNKKTGGTHFDVNISDAYSIKIELSFIDIGQTYSHCFLDNVFVTRQLTDEEIYQAASSTG